MRTLPNIIIVLFISLTWLSGCGNTMEENHHGHDSHEHEAKGEKHAHSEEGSIHFSPEQFQALEMKVDSLPRRIIASGVKASGQLEVPPQNEATVTSILGANISSIQVIEGDEVKKGQVLAYLSHPNVTKIQSDYLDAFNRLQFLEQEYHRQKRLYDEQVASGKTFQQTQADYRSAQGLVQSLESQLRQLGINAEQLKKGKFSDKMPVVSPIDGSVVKVLVKTGQYVQPEKELFEIVNTHHIHADVMVFEKDVYKVNKGQRLRFTVETLPDKELYAEIYSVGKKFEQEPKAIHVHAEIENKTGMLIPGMYIQGQILTDTTEAFALPEDAIIREEDKVFAFVAVKEASAWMFTPVEVKTGVSNNGWVAIQFMAQPPNALFVMNNAYYLQAELKKGEAEHSH